MRDSLNMNQKGGGIARGIRLRHACTHSPILCGMQFELQLERLREGSGTKTKKRGEKYGQEDRHRALYDADCYSSISM